MPVRTLHATVRVEYQEDGEPGLIVVQHALRDVYLRGDDTDPARIQEHVNRVLHAVSETGLLRA